MSSAIEVAIVTGSFTLGGVVLTYLGSGLRDRRQRSRDAHAAREKQVAEVTAAADDLRQRVQLYQGTWALGRDKAVAAGMQVGRISHDLLPELPSLKLRNHIAAVVLTIASELAVDGLIGKLVNTAGTMYFETIAPAVNRLTTAISPLRISSDTDLAAAAQDLLTAAIMYANAAKSGGRKLKRAGETFDKALSRFISAGA